MSPTIFYSWQSDLPNRTNRRLIHDALDEAAKLVNADLEEADRGEAISIDQDTQGVPGSPEIATTIFKKIEGCTVFVPDISFIGKAKNRWVPSPNVMIEYGFAVGTIGNSAILPVFNTAFGDWQDLPFDMSHKRKPILFDAPEGSSDEKKKARKDACQKLAKDLARFIGFSIDSSTSPAAGFTEAEPLDGESSFFPAGNPIGISDSWIRGSTESIYLESGARLFIRLLPTHDTTLLQSVEASQLVRSMPALGSWTGGGSGRNEHGSFFYAVPQVDETPKLLTWTITQLFLSREIWSIDTSLLAVRHEGKAYISPKPVEETLNRALDGFLEIAQEKLKLLAPLRVRVGMCGVEGFKLALDRRLQATLVKDDVIEDLHVRDFQIPAREILEPFYRSYFDAAGVPRA